MDKKTKLAWLKRYSETNAVSGFEAPMKELLQERLAGKAEVSYDKLGSVVFTNASADEKMLRQMKMRRKLCWLAIWMKLVLWLSILPRKAF